MSFLQRSSDCRFILLRFSNQYFRMYNDLSRSGAGKRPLLLASTPPAHLCRSLRLSTKVSFPSMALDTQTFPMSRWWAQAGLQAVKSNPAIFSKACLRTARRDLLAGTNMLPAIKNWLLASRLIKKDGYNFLLDRHGHTILANDPNFQRSSTWWAFHLLLCFSPDAAPYNDLFTNLEPSVRSYSGRNFLVQSVAQQSEGRLSEGSVETYLTGIFKTFERGGALAGLGLIEVRRDRKAEGDSTFYRLGTPMVPDGAILLAVALARERFFPTRASIDFSELIGIHADHFLITSQDTLRARIKQIAQTNGGVQYTTNANLDSLSFDSLFSVEQVMVTFLQEGADTWM
jgi:hypothetical protein